MLGVGEGGKVGLVIVRFVVALVVLVFGVVGVFGIVVCTGCGFVHRFQDQFLISGSQTLFLSFLYP